MELKHRTLLTIILPIIAISVFSAYAFMNQPTKFISQASFPAFTLDEMSQKSNVIVVGKVKEIKPSFLVYENDDPRLPLVITDVVVEIEKELTGSFNGTEVTVRTLGGKTDKFEHITFDEATFNPSERVLVLLGSDAGGVFKNMHYVSGGSQGKFELRSGKAYNEQHPDGIPEEELVQKIIQSRRR